MRTSRVGTPAVAAPADRAAEVAELAGRNEAAARLIADGRPREAVLELESLLPDCRWLLGDGHPEALVVEGNLAVAYVMLGQDGTGLPIMLANLAHRVRVFGDAHPLTLTARDAVAATHRLAGRLSEALWLYSRVAPQRNQVLGPSHPDTLTTRLGLGLTFAEAGDLAMARDVVVAALQDCAGAGVEPRHAELLRSCLVDLDRAGAAAAPAVPPPRSGPRGAVARPPDLVTIDSGSSTAHGEVSR